MDLNCVVIRFKPRKFSFAVLTMKLSLFNSVWLPKNKQPCPIFLVVLESFILDYLSEWEGEVISRQVSGLFIYGPIMDDLHYLSLSYHIC